MQQTLEFRPSVLAQILRPSTLVTVRLHRTEPNLTIQGEEIKFPWFVECQIAGIEKCQTLIRDTNALCFAKVTLPNVMTLDRSIRRQTQVLGAPAQGKILKIVHLVALGHQSTVSHHTPIREVIIYPEAYPAPHIVTHIPMHQKAAVAFVL